MVFKLNSPVYSLVVYEWQNSVTIRQMMNIFEECVPLFERKPDYVDIQTAQKTKTYKYNWFIKNNVIDRPEDWVGINYLWIREPKILSGFSINFGVSIERRYIEFHIDEYFCSFAEKHIHVILEKLTQILRPIYGYVNKMEYGLQPNYYVLGFGLGSPYDNEDIRRTEFGYIFRKKDGRLKETFRDIYPLNLISEKHLSLKVEGMSLLDWINSGKRGKLYEYAENCWKWDLEPSELNRVRPVMLKAGHLIVPV